MGAFQIVYDDFTGGQYIGPRSTNQPKNTWNGNNIVVRPDGQLVPTGTVLAGTYNANVNVIYDVIQIADTCYAFVDLSGISSTGRMVKINTDSANLFPATPTAYTLTGALGGKVAYRYDPTSKTNKFYYADFGGLGNSVIRSVTTSGTDVAVSSAFPNNTNLTDVVSYKYRLIAYGQSNRRLYYSGTDLTTWNSGTQYYEFDSPISNVIPRTDDVLVVCSSGVFSMTGVLGSGVNIQQILPSDNVVNGMAYGVTLGRSLYFVDEYYSGSLDGRLHRLIGASVEPVATAQIGDFNDGSQGYVELYEARPFIVPGYKLSLQFKSGWTYAQNTQQTFARMKVFDDDIGYLRRGYAIARPERSANNEYFVTAVIAENVGDDTLKFYRTLCNIATVRNIDVSYPLTSGSPLPGSQAAVGTVELPEYWHQKPFTVKETFIEYSNSANAYIACYIEPTGMVDVAPANVSASDSTTLTQTVASSAGYAMYRFRPNNAQKGFGAKPVLTLTNCTVKRVILNCED